MNNKDNNNGNGSGGISFLGMLGILFIGLKIAGIIDWPWYLVLAPIWIPAAIAVALAVIIFMIYKLK